MKFVDGKRIWIIGASSGIGAALAAELASRGARLILSARREEKLNALNKEIDGGHEVYPLDISDQGAVKKAVDTLSGKHKEKRVRIDSVILLAGAYAPATIADMDIDKGHKIVDVNFGGFLNVVHYILPVLKAQKNKGQLVLCGSVAGYRGLPKGQPYSATKAAIMNFAESLWVEEKDLDIKLISPGFVETPMTDKNDFEMPMKIKPAAAAQAIAEGLTKKSFEIHFPKKFTFIMKFLRILPHIMYYPLAKRMLK